MGPKHIYFIISDHKNDKPDNSGTEVQIQLYARKLNIILKVAQYNQNNLRNFRLRLMEAYSFGGRHKVERFVISKVALKSNIKENLPRN